MQLLLEFLGFAIIFAVCLLLLILIIGIPISVLKFIGTQKLKDDEKKAADSDKF